MQVFGHSLRIPSFLKPVIEAGTKLVDHNGLEFAGHLSYTALLAFFPFLIFVGALFGIVGGAPLAENLVGYLFQFAPPDVANTLSTPVIDVMRSRRGDLLTVGGIAALWAASSGIEAVRLVLNMAYGVKERRSFLWRRTQSVLFVFGTAALMLVSSVALVLGPVAWKLLSRFIHLSAQDIFILDLFRYGGAIILMACALLGLHQWLPDLRQKWRHLWPGIGITLLLWVATSSGLSMYLATLGNYSATYGALGGVVITLLFFYISGVVFVFGAELNAALFPSPHARKKRAAAVEAAAAGQPRSQAGQIASDQQQSRA